MKKLVIAGVAAAAFCGAPAFAADMPAKASVYKAPAPLYNWTGCYLGGNVGGIWSKTHVGFPNIPDSLQTDTSSFAGGLQAGCNLMSPSRWVVGVDGDWSWMNLDKATPTGGAFSETYRTNWDEAASVRGRIGYAPDNTLWYITAGPAWAKQTTAQFVHVGAPNSELLSHVHSGWTVGGGVEYAVNQWIFGIEYLYANYGDHTYVCVGCGPAVIKTETNEIRLRLSYKFGDPWGKAPVSAKY
jgi:outer membrane immunogenic protein